MSKIKALILGLLILVPLFVFIFIYTFGEHHFSLRSYFPVTDESGRIVYDANGDTLFQQVPDFTLINQQGKSFSKQELQGKMYVVSFLHTDCSGACRKVTSQLLRVQETFQNNQDVKLISITVKPESDTPETLNRYAAHFNIDTAQWRLLTGVKTDIYSLAQQAFKLPLSATGGPEAFIHTEKVMLVDKNHVVRGVYNATDVVDIDRLMLEINVLIDEYRKRE